MKRIVWVPIVIVAVIVSVALGMRLGGGGKRPPTKEPTVGANGGSTDVNGPKDGKEPISGDNNGDGDDADSRTSDVEVAFTIHPDEPEAGTPVTLKDETVIPASDSVLTSEWRIEGPGLLVPATYEGTEIEFPFPDGGLFRVAHRLQLKESGPTAWRTEVVMVKQSTADTEPPEEVETTFEPPFDGTTIVDAWTDDGVIKIRINSEALGESKDGLVQGLRVNMTYANGETSAFGPGNFRMDIPLSIGRAPSRVSTLALSGTLPSGRTWEHVTHP